MPWFGSSRRIPEFEAQLEWMRDFVQEEVEPLDVLWPDDVYKMPQTAEIKLLLGR